MVVIACNRLLLEVVWCTVSVSSGGNSSSLAALCSVSPSLIMVDRRSVLVLLCPWVECCESSESYV